MCKKLTARRTKNVTVAVENKYPLRKGRKVLGRKPRPLPEKPPRKKQTKRIHRSKMGGKGFQRHRGGEQSQEGGGH